jgi:CotS family spore coat protein
MNIREISCLMGLWGENFIEARTMRDVYQVTTDQGIRCLKEVTGHVDRVLFMTEALNYVYGHGFTRFARCLHSVQGNMVEEHQGRFFIVQEWLEGREPDYRNSAHMILAAETIALFHRAGTGFVPATSKVKNKLGKWPQKLEKKYQELKVFLDAAQGTESPSSFEKVLLRYGKWLHKRGRESIKRIKKSKYRKLVNEAVHKGALVHGDTAARNFILKDNIIYLIDFDSMAIDINIADLWRLLRRVLRRDQWDINLANNMLEAYCRYLPLKAENREVLLAFLYFPEKPWRIIKEYYTKKDGAGWNESSLTERLQEYCHRQEKIDRFLRDFQKTLEPNNSHR